MKKLAIIGSLAAVVILFAIFLYPTGVWSGSTNVRFRFHVVDSHSQRAVRDVKIRVIDNSAMESISDTNSVATFPAVATDAGGLATVSVRCRAGGTDGFFGRTGHFIVSHELFAEADSYGPLSNALANLVGGRRLPLSKRVFDVDLVLSKNP